MFQMENRSQNRQGKSRKEHKSIPTKKKKAVYVSIHINIVEIQITG